MFEEGINKTRPELLMPLISCFAESGSKIAVTDGGFFSSEIMVMDGPEAGCSGIVSNEVPHRLRPRPR
jgi:hypothetical protein